MSSAPGAFSSMSTLGQVVTVLNTANAFVNVGLGIEAIYIQSESEKLKERAEQGEDVKKETQEMRKELLKLAKKAINMFNPSPEEIENYVENLMRELTEYDPQKEPQIGLNVDTLVDDRTNLRNTFKTSLLLKG